MWHHYHCGGCTFSRFFSKTQAGLASCASWHPGFQRIQFQGRLPCSEWKSLTVPGAPSACALCPAAPYCLCTPSHTQGRGTPQPRKLTKASSTRQNQLQCSHAPHIFSFQYSFSGKKEWHALSLRT